MSKAYRSPGPLGSNGWSIRDNFLNITRNSFVQIKDGYVFGEYGVKLFKLMKGYVAAHINSIYNCTAQLSSVSSSSVWVGVKVFSVCVSFTHSRAHTFALALTLFARTLAGSL